MSLIHEKLKAAITGEFNAARKYGRWAEIAASEGYANIAYLFTSLEKAERIHIKNQKNALQEPVTPAEQPIEAGTTLENVTAAVAGETHEFKEMYPNFLAEIKRDPALKTLEGKAGRLALDWARQVEITHAQALQLALAALQTGKDLDLKDIYICRVCGNLVLKDPLPAYCPICGHDEHFFAKVERPKKKEGK
jgi:rubrerythrin